MVGQVRSARSDQRAEWRNAVRTAVRALGSVGAVCVALASLCVRITGGVFMRMPSACAEPVRVHWLWHVLITGEWATSRSSSR